MSTRKKTGLGIAAAGAAAMAISAGTFATFNDTESAAPGGVSAGTLNLTVGGGTESGEFTVDGVAPGYNASYAKPGQELTFRNSGSIDGDLILRFSLAARDNGCNEPEREAEQELTPGAACNVDVELPETLRLRITGPNGVLFENLVTKLPDEVQVSELRGGEVDGYVFEFTVREGEGNAIQSDSVNLTVEGYLEGNEDQAD